MSKSPHWHHQATCTKVAVQLTLWCESTGSGQAVITPGVIFADADDVISDVVWISDERLAALMDNAGHVTGAPEFAVEVLSFGVRNEERDRTAKRKLYETQGVREYWILDWRLKQVEVYCRKHGELRLVTTLPPNVTFIWISMSEMRPCTSASCGASSARIRPSRNASSQSAGWTNHHPQLRNNLTRSCGITFVKDEVDHYTNTDDRRATRNVSSGKGALGARNALDNGWCGRKKSPRNLFSSQTTQQSQRERHPRLSRQHGMAGNEDQTQQIIAYIIQSYCFHIYCATFLLIFELTAKFSVFSLDV